MYKIGRRVIIKTTAARPRAPATGNPLTFPHKYRLIAENIYNLFSKMFKKFKTFVM